MAIALQMLTPIKDFSFMNAPFDSYRYAKFCFLTSAGADTSSATPVAPSTQMVYRHANVCSGTKRASRPPRQRIPPKHLRYGHGTHSTACQPPSKGTRSRKELSWLSFRGSSQGVSTWVSLQASRCPAAPIHISLTP